MRLGAGARAAVVLGLGIVALASAPRSMAAPVASEQVAPADSREAGSYWSDRRIRRARPLDLVLGAGADSTRARAASPGSFSRFEVTDTTSFPNRTHGKVFFTIPGQGNFFCTGTVVSSLVGRVVLTAGHCVHGGGPGQEFATNWMFVPGYRNGAEPFGEWPATGLATTEGWADAANVSFDVGAAVVAPDSSGRGIEEVVGARGIGFHRPREQEYRSYGYPAGPLPLAFNGEKLFACDSPYRGDDIVSAPPPMEIGCDMNEGSSGGAWVAEGSLVSSVNSYKYLLQPDSIYGPYFGDTIASLYERVGGRMRCAGRTVTEVGGSGPDAVTGTDGKDVFKTGLGDDLIIAADGRDRVCSGPGADTILAGADEDVAVGNGGRDILKGGRGDDICRGGSGRDRAPRCEHSTRVP